MTADCAAKCQASCQGECRADANLTCQAYCQANGYAKCEADLKLKCQGECKMSNRPVLCSGQYIDRGDNFQECIDALKSRLNITVSGTSSSSGTCQNNTCTGTAQAEGTASCATLPVRGRGGALGGAVAGMLVALGLMGRRRRQAR
jgi:hypothetical protein